MHECVLYKKYSNKLVKCTACNHRCRINQNQTGICGVRKNINGKLYLLVYGKVIAKHIDPVEKKPLYHFLPGSEAFSIGTIGCNFKCEFCQNFEISQSSGLYNKKIIGQVISPKEILNQALKNNCRSIAYTYNEPTIFTEFVYDCAKLAKQRDIKNILVTNGYMTPECLKYLAPYIDAMNIDLKSINEKFYNNKCKAKLKHILETIEQAYKKQIWIEITTLLIPKENDSKKELTKIAKFISHINPDIPWHISRFFPHYKMSHKQATPLKKLYEAYEIGKKYLNNVYLGNVQEENYSDTFCKNCRKAIIKRTTYLINNSLIKSSCPYCKEEIPGVFSKL